MNTTTKFETVNAENETLTMNFGKSGDYKELHTVLADENGKTIEGLSICIDENKDLIIENTKFSGFALKLLLDFIDQAK